MPPSTSPPGPLRRPGHSQKPEPSGIDRRNFLRLGAALPGFALACGTNDEENESRSGTAEMRYRPLGDTGLQVSEISFGSVEFNNPGLLLAALDAGINTVSTSDSAAYGRSEELIGEAIRSLGSRREELILLTGSVVRPGTSKQSILDGIDATLRRLHTDHVEVYVTANVGSPEDLRVDALFEAFEEAKGAGKVGHLGLSGHRGGMQDCLNAAMEDDRFEVFFTKYDFVSYPDQDQILRKATDRGIGTIVFKTNAGNRQGEVQDLQEGGLSFRQATIKWALTNPDVASVCVGITNFDQIRECTEAVGGRLNQAEVGMLQRYAEAMRNRYCRFCGVCEAGCPRGVTVSEVMRYAMYYKYYGREKRSMQLYEALAGESLASSCEGCWGPCERRCPFGRPVRAELVEAHRLLSRDWA